MHILQYIVTHYILPVILLLYHVYSKKAHDQIIVKLSQVKLSCYTIHTVTIKYLDEPNLGYPPPPTAGPGCPCYTYLMSRAPRPRVAGWVVGGGGRGAFRYPPLLGEGGHHPHPQQHTNTALYTVVCRRLYRRQLALQPSVSSGASSSPQQQTNSHGLQGVLVVSTAESDIYLHPPASKWPNIRNHNEQKSKQSIIPTKVLLAVLL